MSQINPITGSILQAPTVQRQQESQKASQIRQAQDRHRNSATADEEEVEESVSSADGLQPIGDDQQGHPQGKGAYSRGQPKDSDSDSDGERLDLQA
ncbi:MAG TPA: hypothetical protein VHX86_02295 [Tepidisphaeraceae bacterium]|nr:hypothetical protein [Tepidisphaeraceae bacterium]